MKIIQFIASRGYGGAEKVFVDLCNELEKKTDISLEVLLLKNNKISKYLNKNIKIYYLSDYSRYNLRLYLSVFKIVKNKIIHTHGIKATKIIYIISLFNKLNFVATKHNTRKGSIFNKIKNVTAVSKSVSRTIKNSNKINIIYNGIRLENTKKIFHSNKFSILCIGRLDKVKGFDILIENIRNLNIEYKLFIVGEGKEEENLKKLIIKYNLESKVELLGFRNDIPNLIDSSDLVLISSISEGFSLVAIESLFYSKVLISTKVGICKEILNTEFLINNFDFVTILTNVYNNYEYYSSEFSKIKIQNKNRFLLEYIIEEYINIYILLEGQ